MKNQELFERIERYLNGDMSGSEKMQFEKELKANEELARAFEDQREIQMAVEIGALKENLDEIHSEVIPLKQTSKNNWWAIAAGIAVILAAGVYLFQQEGKQDELFATYSTTEPGLPVPMSSVDHYIFYDAMVDYKAEKYEVAIKKWKGLVRAEPMNDTLNYYVGSAYFNLENYDEAVNYFSKVDENANSAFKYKSEWYSVLSWIKLEETDKILALNPPAQSPYFKKIKEIQKALEK